MSEDWFEQERGHQCWRIIRLFYESLEEFSIQHKAYDERVLELARERRTPRESLRLTADLLGSLLDFKALERLRDGSLFELKDLCHHVFRTKSETDPLDRFISDIFHEISILKEEHYTVKFYAPMHERAADREFLEIILDEAHEIFPKKMLHAATLFARARDALERHLPSMRRHSIVVRSLWLERDGFVARVHRDGIRYFYRLMYPSGAAEGFFDVGRSFREAGFLQEALLAWERAEKELEREVTRAVNGERARGTLDFEELQRRLEEIRLRIQNGRREAEKRGTSNDPPLVLQPVELAREAPPR